MPADSADSQVYSPQYVSDTPQLPVETGVLPQHPHWFYSAPLWEEEIVHTVLKKAAYWAPR